MEKRTKYGKAFKLEVVKEVLVSRRQVYKIRSDA